MSVGSAVSRPRNDCRFGGFSLVEIVVVLVILGVSATVVVPALQGITRTDGTSATAGEIMKVLRAAGRTAVDRAIPVMVLITPATREYAVEGIERSDSVAILARGAFAASAGITLVSQGPRMRVTFDRYGVVRADSITVHGDEGSAVVGVNRWTGDVYVRPAGR